MLSALQFWQANMYFTFFFKCRSQQTVPSKIRRSSTKIWTSSSVILWSSWGFMAHPWVTAIELLCPRSSAMSRFDQDARGGEGFVLAAWAPQVAFAGSTLLQEFTTNCKVFGKRAEHLNWLPVVTMFYVAQVDREWAQAHFAPILDDFGLSPWLVLIMFIRENLCDHFAIKEAPLQQIQSMMAHRFETKTLGDCLEDSKYASELATCPTPKKKELKLLPCAEPGTLHDFNNLLLSFFNPYWIKSWNLLDVLRQCCYSGILASESKQAKSGWALLWVQQEMVGWYSCLCLEVYKRIYISYELIGGQ